MGTKGRWQAAALIATCGALGFGSLAVADERASVAVYELGALLAVAATWCCVARLRSAPGRWAWALLALGLTAWVAGDLVWDSYLVRGLDTPTVSAADVLYLAGYPLLAAGIALLLAARGDRLRDGLLDGLVLTVAAALAAWTFLAAPAIEEGGSWLESTITAAYPLADALLVAAVAWLAFSDGRRRSDTWLAAFLVGTLAIDVAYAALALAGSESLLDIVDCAYPVSYALLAVAAGRAASESAPVRREHRARVHPGRPLFLGGSLLLALLVTVWTPPRGAADHAMVVTASVLLVVLVVARVTVLVNRREAAQAALAHRAAHDVLTGLANRTELQARVAAALADAPHGGVTVAYFDLDGFKHVNDRRGHRAGDEVLQIAASRLRAALRPSDVLARMGGDEFVVLYEGPVDVETARRIAGRALHSLDRPVVRQRDLDRISASAGVAVSKAGDDEDTLLAHADAALYEAKRRGGGVVAAFDDGMRSALSRRRRIELELDASLHTSAFQVHYQPVLRLGDGEVAGFEALARWHLSDGTAVPPTEFVGVAEATGLIHELGAVVLERACHDVVVWNATREPGSRLGVSVNVSARQLRRPDFTRLVERTLEQTGVPPSWLMLELTESTLIDDLETAAAQLAHLRTVGVRLAIDDFGTGFSALSALRALPLQVLKVDRSFVSGIGVDPDACAVLASLVDLSHALGLEVLVEGMETTAQLDQVASTGCDLAQGFAIARPMPAAEVGPWLRARSLTAVGASTSAAPAVEGPSEDEREQHRAHERHEHRP